MINKGFPVSLGKFCSSHCEIMAFKPTCQTLTEHTSSQFKYLKKNKTRKNLPVFKKTALCLEEIIHFIKRCINNFPASKTNCSQAIQLDIISFAMGIYQSHHSSQFCLRLFSFSCILSSFSHQATI